MQSGRSSPRSRSADSFDWRRPATYGHSEREDHREAYGRALRFDRPAHEPIKPADDAHVETHAPPAQDDARG